MPALSKAGAVWRPSGSSHIYHNGQDVTGQRGQHFLLLIEDASDAPRIIKILAALLYLHGLGKVIVSKSGSLLIRCPIDTAPTDSARLVFAGGAECGPGLEQKIGPALILNRAGFVDTRALVEDLTVEQLGQVEARIEQDKMAKAGEAAQRRLEHRGAMIAQRLPELMRRGLSATEGEQRIGAAVDAAYGGTLLADFVLTVIHDDGREEEIPVGQALGDRMRWDGEDIREPLNPGHRGGAPDCRLYLLGTSPIAFSLDDGGIVYRLRAAQQRIVVAKGSRGELVAQLANAIAADDRVFSTDAGPVLVEAGKMRNLTVDRLINLIGGLVVLVTKTAKGESPTDLTREVAVLVLAALGG